MSPSASTLSRQREHATRDAAGVWWAEVEDVRDRIERRRALERDSRARRGLPPPRRGAAARRTVTITGRTALQGADMPLRLAEREATGALEEGEHASRASAGGRGGASPPSRRRSRTTAEWLGSSPDRIAAWAVALGFLLVIAGIISAH